MGMSRSRVTDANVRAEKKVSACCEDKGPEPKCRCNKSLMAGEPPGGEGIRILVRCGHSQLYSFYIMRPENHTSTELQTGLARHCRHCLRSRDCPPPLPSSPALNGKRRLTHVRQVTRGFGCRGMCGRDILVVDTGSRARTAKRGPEARRARD